MNTSMQLHKKTRHPIKNNTWALTSERIKVSDRYNASVFLVFKEWMTYGAFNKDDWRKGKKQTDTVSYVDDSIPLNAIDSRGGRQARRCYKQVNAR